MTTREEFAANSREELRYFTQVWEGLFLGHDEQKNLSQALEDVHHSPSSLKAFVDSLLNEGVEHVREGFNKEFENAPDVMDSDKPIQYIVDGLLFYASITAIRMFRLGQEVNVRYPWDKLTPCSCKTLADDEVDEFLQASSELRFLQEGGVIPEPDENGGKT